MVWGVSMVHSSSWLSGIHCLLIKYLEEQNDLRLKIESSYSRVNELLPFKSMEDLYTFFQHADFQTSRSIDTFYGSLILCPASDRLLQLFLQDNCTLKRMSALFLSQSPRIFDELEDLLGFKELFVTLVLTNFYVFWAPMIHSDYINHDGATASLDSVREFLSDLRVFECLFDSAKEQQHFICSWMQNMWISNNKEKPSWNLHMISDRLVANVEEVLPSSINNCFTFFSEISRSLKVSKFLFEASEFLHSFQVSRTIFNSLQSFNLLNPNLEGTSIRYQYEALCVMLQSMNAYVMYLKPEHRQILYETAPRLFLRINQLGLSLAVDAQAERKLLISLPRDDHAAGFRRGLDLLSFSSGLLEEIGFNNSSSEHSERQSSFDVNERLNNLFSETTPLGSPSRHSYISVETTADGKICTAFGLAELGAFYYAICKYRLAYRFASLALEQLCCSKACSPRAVVQVLRLVCRICIIKRKYDLGMKITLWLAQFIRETLGSHNILYANVLLDVGCLFLSTDNTTRAVEFYRIGLSVLLDCLPGASVAAASALEDLAYALYVHEYTSGNFDLALKCAENAMKMLKQLGHRTSMQRASARRVQALILEEIALGESDPERMHSKLMFARKLHLLSLDICERTFGVWNIQTAKHFGNLGRLFQSLENNSVAEEMHQKAIMIKEHLLGPNDFEVGLSVGHLASLYNYHMEEYEKAEKLYLRSIQINLNLFGPGYSGLEYDYRGLQRVYRKMGNWGMMNRYIDKFYEWQQYRLHHNTPQPSSISSGLVGDDAAHDHFEPSPPTVDTQLNALWEEFCCEFEVVFGEEEEENTKEVTCSPSE